MHNLNKNLTDSNRIGYKKWTLVSLVVIFVMTQLLAMPKVTTTVEKIFNWDGSENTVTISIPTIDRSKQMTCMFTTLDLKHPENSTLAFRKAASSILTKHTFPSIYRQCDDDLSSCDSLAVYDILINYAQVKEVFGSEEAFLNALGVLQRNDPNKEWSKVHLNVKDRKKVIKERIDENECEWVAFLRLDADDILGEGFVPFALKQIETLNNTTTENNQTWLGAGIFLEAVQQLFVGYGHCKYVPIGESSQRFYGGWSQGQMRVFGRQMYDALHTKDIYRPVSHTFTLAWMRQVALDYMSNITNNANQLDAVTNYKRRAKLHELETESRVKRLEAASLGFPSAALYYLTPVSGHFPWSTLHQDVPLCNEEQRRKILQQINYTNYDFIFDSTVTSNMSLVDACQSNHFFHTAQKKFSDKHNNDCLKMDLFWQQQRQKYNNTNPRK